MLVIVMASGFILRFVYYQGSFVLWYVKKSLTGIVYLKKKFLRVFFMFRGLHSYLCLFLWVFIHTCVLSHFLIRAPILSSLGSFYSCVHFFFFLRLFLILIYSCSFVCFYLFFSVCSLVSRLFF